MQNTKLQTGLILEIERPLLTLDAAGLQAVFSQADFFAQRAHAEEDQESFRARLMWHTAHHMLKSAELELASRN